MYKYAIAYTKFDRYYDIDFIKATSTVAALLKFTRKHKEEYKRSGTNFIKNYSHVNESYYY